ncbi:MAG: tetraacyldisaccharide 4'-kinase [Gemmatimonadota bacterium]|nr:tetraacyldisaccharide 4'-kinase [Gemmatimonadota bacterium]MDH5196745.1 tetraacyldisaccharide 4'-kinase [Gemmatimonadota bacterium]
MRALWTSMHPLAVGGRLLLAPVASAYHGAMRLRARGYATGRWVQRPLPLPSIGVGNLQVGGAGKTPLASWVATWLADRGSRPGILLRGYGGDEAPLHRAAVPTAVVVEDPDRQRGARAAQAAGAAVLVLDDNAQHLAVIPDRQLLLLGVEVLQGPRALLPAGPWRQPWDTGTADVVVLTRRMASDEAVADARTLVARAYPGTGIAVARLQIVGWRHLRDGSSVSATALADAALFVLCGVADPRPFAAHARRLGTVRAFRYFRDHAPYPTTRIRSIARAAESTGVDYVVTTAKDAVKLRAAWPADAPPVLVGDLGVRWDGGEEVVTRELEACLAMSRAHTRFTHAAAGTAAGTA